MNWPFRKQGFKDAAQKLVFERAKEAMRHIEQAYRTQVSAFGCTVHPEGLFQIRLFAANFCLCAMTMAMGRDRHKEAEEVYLALMDEACRKLSLTRARKEELSTDLLKEQSHALVQEQKNAGSAQFTLLTLYVSALQKSTGPLDNAGQPFEEPVISVLGSVIGDLMTRWTELFQELSGHPLHTYDEGFERTSKDSERLGE